MPALGRKQPLESRAAARSNTGSSRAPDSRDSRTSLPGIGVKLYSSIDWNIAQSLYAADAYRSLLHHARCAKALGERGPALGRPQVDTLNGSKHANMKELRCRSNGGVWRVAFAFDPKRNAVVLVAGDKSGVSEKRFYASLIATADVRYDEHLSDLKGAEP